MLAPVETCRSDCTPLRALCRWCSGLNTVGIFLTFLFVPEPLRVPLAELDRRYAYTSAGKVYHGVPVLCVSCLWRLTLTLPADNLDAPHGFFWSHTLLATVQLMSYLLTR